MWIVKLALRRTYTFVVAALLIAVLGAVSIYRMSTDIFPNIDVPVISVVWSYFGMPADEVETRIVFVNERILTASVNGVDHIESQALNGVGVIRIYFRSGASIAEAQAQVTATCQTLLKVMPPGITPPFIVRYSATSVPIVQIAISSDTLSEQQIFDYAQNFVIQQLGTVQGARVPQPWGGRERQIMVSLDPDALYAQGLSPNDVSAAIGSQNLIIPAGTAKMGDREYIVKLNSSPETIAAFNDIPIRTTHGVPVYVKNVARVTDSYRVQTNIVRRDGRRAVLMTILNGEGASTLSVVEGVRAALARIQTQLPPELKMELMFDQSVFVRAAVDGVLKEGAIAAGLTALMILLFLGSWRSTLIVATSIPLSILKSIIALWALGYTLNTMTLGGMALAVGILAVATMAGALAAGIRPRLQRERELKAAEAEVSTALPRVPVATAKSASPTAEHVLPADARPLLEAAIYARTAGYLKSRRADIGDRVKEGDLLAEIASPEVDAQLEQARAFQALAQANLERDQASSDLADTDLRRSRKLVARQAVPQQEFEGFLARDKVADANVLAAKANLRVNEANIHRLETLQSFQKVTAPFSGVITARNFDPGDLATADSTSTREMFHLVRMDTLRIFANVPQMFSTDVKVGQKAIVYRRETPKRTFTGTVTRTADALDLSTRTLLTEVQVLNRDGALRPGMYLQVKFLFERQVPTVLIPAAALATRADGPRLVVLDAQNRVHYRTVQLGRDFGSETEVLAGIDPGETVVINPGDGLPEGTVVQPVGLPTK
jgi:RND family efflux transporter MFP subunit